MPESARPVRKRGKKHRKDVKEDFVVEEVEPEAGPSWIADSKPEKELDLPYGELDPDLKAYFKSVEVELEQWQASSSTDKVLTEEEASAREMLISAAVSEMQGKELVLATDPEGSKILERMIQYMDDGSRKTLIQAMAGSFRVLVQHLFASHVCQTLSRTIPRILCKEAMGDVPRPPDAYNGGPLQPMKSLLVNTAEELLPDGIDLIINPFATHVLRELPPMLAARSWGEMITHDTGSTLKSSKRKQREVQVNCFEDGFEFPSTSEVPIPFELRSAAGRTLSRFRKTVTPDSLRTYARDPIANPCIQALIKAEIALAQEDRPGSLLDWLLPGVVSGQGGVNPIEDHFETLARDSAGSHLIEMVITEVPETIRFQIWRLYVSPLLGTLIEDPVANFVVAKAIEKVDRKQLKDIVELPEDVWTDCVVNRRIGPLRALVDRTVKLRLLEDKTSKIVMKAFGIPIESPDALVPYVLSLTRFNDAEDSSPPTGINMQGALLLQSMMRLSEPHSLALCSSIERLPAQRCIDLCKNAIASHVFEALLDSPTIPYRFKRQLALSFAGTFQYIVNDRIASHVGDRLWAMSDPFVRERLVRPLINYESNLQATSSGRIFLKKACIWQLLETPEVWKRHQAEEFAAGSFPTRSPTLVSLDEAPMETKSDKRKARDEPEAQSPTKKTKHLNKNARVKLEYSDGPDGAVSGHHRVKPPADLNDVFRALAHAP